MSSVLGLSIIPEKSESNLMIVTNSLICYAFLIKKFEEIMGGITKTDKVERMKNTCFQGLIPFPLYIAMPS
jgi:hypothetical protein